MKKKLSLRVIIPAAVVLVLLGTMAAVSGSNITSSDPLISLSYLTGVFQNRIMQQVDSKVSTESSKLQSTFDRRLSGMGTASGMQAAATATHTSANIPAGSSYTVPANGEVLLLSGDAVVNSAGLTDMTDGVTVSIGGEMTVNHLYTATASVVIRSQSGARILIRK